MDYSLLEHLNECSYAERRYRVASFLAQMYVSPEKEWDPAPAQVLTRGLSLEEAICGLIPHPLGKIEINSGRYAFWYNYRVITEEELRHFHSKLELTIPVMSERTLEQRISIMIESMNDDVRFKMQYNLRRALDNGTVKQLSHYYFALFTAPGNSHKFRELMSGNLFTRRFINAKTAGVDKVAAHPIGKERLSLLSEHYKIPDNIKSIMTE